jgi:protein TonB
MSETLLPEALAGDRQALPPTRDRLLTTTFLVGSLHALVILGVTFAPPHGGGGTPPSLEVLIVHDPVPEADLNKDADYLAQVNQHGSGTGRDVRGAESPRATAADSGANGTSESGRRGRPDRGRGDADVVASRAEARDRRHFATTAAAGAPMSQLVLEPLTGEADGADAGTALALRGAPLHELMVTANTRESSVAVYLDRWRHRIERIGAANYPLDAVRRAGFTGSPVLEVRLLASGKLADVTIQRSSGYLTLDQAALNILRLSAPFEPFPRQLAAKHDALRISYEWQFLGGDATESTVRMPADTR